MLITKYSDKGGDVMLQSKSKLNTFVNIIIYTALAVSAILCIAPMINTLAISFSDSAVANAGMVYFIPIKFTMASYQKLLSDSGFITAFGVSLKRVALGGAINLVLTVTMAYPLSKSKKEFPARNIYMWILVFTMVFSGGLIPWYMTIKSLGLLDTIWALVLPTAVPVFNVILMMNYFRGLPKELEEAASIDGAGSLRTLISIILPVSLPVLATVTLFSLVGHWNSFFDGMILMNNKANWPLQTYVQQLVTSFQSVMNVKDPEELKRLMETSNKTFNAAKVFITMLPILILYPFLQKYFMGGIVLGAIKE